MSATADTDFYEPDSSSSTYSQEAYQAAIAAGATPAQAAQYAGSQNQYADDPSEAKDIVPGEDAAAAYAREKKQGVPVGSANFKAGDPQSSTTENATAAGASGPSAVQPTYLSTLFPKGLPTATAAQVGNISQVGAPSTSNITQSIMSALSPQFAQQDQAETEALANAGIVGGSTTGAMGALGVQQQQQALSAMAPYIMQGYQMDQTAQQDNQQAQLGASEFNAQGQNQTSEFNAGNAISGAEFDSGEGLSAEEYLASLQNNDYLTQLGLQGNVITAGETGQTGAYQPIYTQPSGTNLSGLGTALAPSGTSTPSNTGSGVYNPNSGYSTYNSNEDDGYANGP